MTIHTSWLCLKAFTGRRGFDSLGACDYKLSKPELSSLMPPPFCDLPSVAPTLALQASVADSIQLTVFNSANIHADR